ncbi:MAG: hypothetical protein ACRD0J_10475 [Acidimicrobiales bacterium]
MAGFVAREVDTELPGLRLRHATVAHRPGRSSPELVRRLRWLSDRVRGAGVVAMRTNPVPRAYRSFFRQIGLDPDVRPVPSEEAAIARLLHGGFRSTTLLGDACLVGLLETGVPVWALDAALVDELGPGIRTSTVGDPVGPRLIPGSLVVADGSSVHAELFGEPLDGHGVNSRTTRVTLYAVAVDGVPEIHLDEALWCVLELI